MPPEHLSPVVTFDAPSHHSPWTDVQDQPIVENDLNLGAPTDANYGQDNGSPAATIVSELLTTDLATTRWFDLLSTDAAQADGGFSLAPTRQPSPASDGIEIPFQAESRRQPWQLESDIVLLNHEIQLLRAFTDHVSKWLDILDPHCHFAVHATQLAVCSTLTSADFNH